VQLVLREYKVLLELQDLLDQQVELELQELQDLRVHKDLLV
jgi:hypothetical protein